MVGRFRGAAVACIGLSCLFVTGCVGGVSICPAIAYLYSAEIELDDPDSRAADIEVCADDECASTRPGYSADSDGLTSVAPSGAARWTATFGGTPETIDLRILDPEGTVILESAADLDWVADSGYGNCAAPASVAPVTLTFD